MKRTRLISIDPKRLHRLSTACSVLLLLTACGNKTETATNDQLVAEMAQRISTITRSTATDGVVPRFNQAKTLGCFDAQFQVKDNLPSQFKKGLFENPQTYQATLRFANASTIDDSEKDLRGISIKVSGVAGDSLWGEKGTQDFLFNSYPALFVATPEDFLDFIKARQADKKLSFFINPLNPHLKSLWILYKARQKHNSPFDIRYWSTTPSKLGEDGTTVKYSVTPCSTHKTSAPVNPGRNQLRAAMKDHLNQAPACFELGVQTRGNPDTMPIEDASVIWSEEESPFVSVATITVEQQAFDSADALQACETMTFNPWQSLAAHQPLGKMNEVRREVYARAATVRNTEAQ